MGMPLVRQLLAAGHEVTGTTRFEERAEASAPQGAEATICDALEPSSSPRGRRGAAGGRRPRDDRPCRIGSTTGAEGRSSRRHQPAAQRGDAQPDRRRDGRGRASAWSPRASPSSTSRRATGSRTRTRRSLTVHSGAHSGPRSWPSAGHERQVLGGEGIEGVVLRFGAFYGPGTSMRRRAGRGGGCAQQAFPIVGKGTGRFSFIHVDDAAAATVAAISGPTRPGVFNIVDDEPALAAGLGPGLRRGDRGEEAAQVPALARKLIAGPFAASAESAEGSLERQGEGRARLGAALPELAPGLRRGARLTPRP